MTCRGEILPVLLLIALPVFCFITYGIAVSLGHVNASFPYISDTGTHPPESCVFGLLQGLYAFLSAICVFIRYEQVRSVYKDSGRQILHRTNRFSLFQGVLSAFGVYIVANFQETNVLVVHLIGAALAFVGGNIYCWIQTVMTYRMKEIPGFRPWMPHVRLVLTILHLLLCIMVGVAPMFASSDSDVTTTAATTTATTTLRSLEDSAITPRWSPSDPGYTAHLVSTAMEWVLAMTTAIFFCTYAMEFRYFRVQFPQVHYAGSFDINEMIQENSNGVLKEVKISTIEA